MEEVGKSCLLTFWGCIKLSMLFSYEFYFNTFTFADVNETTILKTVPASLFVLGAVGLLALSEYFKT